MRQLSTVAVCMIIFAASTPARAQSPAIPQPRMVIVTVPAPIYLLPDTSREALRVASAGSALRLLDRTADWCHVEFQDPQFGRRIGYIEAKFVQPERNLALEPVDLSVPPQRPADRFFPQQPGAPAEVLTRQLPAAALSRAAGFFIGFGYEGAAILTEVTDTVNGTGGSFVIGYGFNQDWSLYGEISGADIQGTGLAHIDVGVRAHFLAPTSRAVPFVQIAFDSRGVSDGSFSAAGAGVSFGGGANIHITPTFAFSPAITWTIGTFSQYKIGNGPIFAGPEIRATSARVHLGLIWFTQASHNAANRTR